MEFVKLKRNKTLYVMMFFGFLFVLFAMSASAASFDESKSYVLINKNSGKALDLFDWQTEDDAKLVQWDRNDLAVQQWKIIDEDFGKGK